MSVHWRCVWGGLLLCALTVGARAQPQDEDSTEAASAATPSRRPPPVWSLDIHAPRPLKRLLSTYLDLARYQKESGQGGDEGAQSVAANRVSRGELRRLVAAAPEQVRSLLEAEGYFAAKIHASVSEEQPGQPIVIRIDIEPGPLTHIARLQTVFEGELDNRLSQDDADARALVSELHDQWALPVGDVFRQASWSAAKNAMLARMRAEGYPLSSWSGTSATVDAQLQSAKLFVVADSGPLFHFGDIAIEGLRRQSASSVLNVAPFSKGQPYREQALIDYQERLQKLNLFDNVFVTLNPDPAQADAAPVTVQLREMQLQQATVGVGASSDTGPRISLEHLHRRFMGWDWLSKVKLQLGKVESDFQADFTSHPLPERKRWLVSTALSRQLDSARSRTDSKRLRVGQLQEGERLERTRYVEYQQAAVTSSAGEKVSGASALSGTLQWVWRDVDNQLLPTKGVTAVGMATLGQSFSTLDASGSFGRAYGRVTWYRPLPSGWYWTSRLEAGRVIARESVSVPDTLLFRAGGDESVRGYAYRDLGVMVDGVKVGGRAMATGSIELAHAIVDRYPSILGAVFIDAGGVAQQFAAIRPQRGYGVGVHWRSPVGPLRLDLAYGEGKRQLRLHFSVGISL